MTNRFDDIQNKELQTWNRCATIFNLMKDHSAAKAAAYAGLFSPDDRKAISNMYNKIKDKGYEFTRAEINRNVQASAMGNG